MTSIHLEYDVEQSAIETIENSKRYYTLDHFISYLNWLDNSEKDKKISDFRY